MISMDFVGPIFFYLRGNRGSICFNSNRLFLPVRVVEVVYISRSEGSLGFLKRYYCAHFRVFRVRILR